MHSCLGACNCISQQMPNALDLGEPVMVASKPPIMFWLTMMAVTPPANKEQGGVFVLLCSCQ